MKTQLSLFDILAILDRLGLQHISELAQEASKLAAPKPAPENTDCECADKCKAIVISIDALLGDYLFEANNLVELDSDVIIKARDLLSIRDYYSSRV